MKKDLPQHVMKISGRLVPVYRDYSDIQYPVWRSCRTGRAARDYDHRSQFPRAKPYALTLRPRANSRRVKRRPIDIDIRAHAEVWRDVEVYPDAPYVLIVRGKLVARYTSVKTARHAMAEVWPADET